VSYDTNGNETSDGSRTFSYDLANRLTASTDGSTATSYTYDGDGNRLQASTGTAPSQQTKYAWDESNPLAQLALERDGNATLLRRYAYGIRRISMTTGGSTHYFAYDGLSSVANLISASGSTEWTYSYEPYGSQKTEDQNDSSAPSNPMKFAGDMLDPTSLYYLRARQYDPNLGRFLMRDPLDTSETSSEASSYVYALDRPTVLGDPSGLCPQPIAPSEEGRHLASYASSEAVAGYLPQCGDFAPFATGSQRSNFDPFLRVELFIPGYFSNHVFPFWYNVRAILANMLYIKSKQARRFLVPPFRFAAVRLQYLVPAVDAALDPTFTWRVRIIGYRVLKPICETELGGEGTVIPVLGGEQ
jgi:RHS repeat-associated protein